MSDDEWVTVNRNRPPPVIDRWHALPERLGATQSNAFSEGCENHTFSDPDFSTQTTNDTLVEKSKIPPLGATRWTEFTCTRRHEVFCVSPA